MARPSDPEETLQWRRRLGRFRNNELSVTEFCRKEGVSAASFYHWRKKLASRTPEPAALTQPAFKPVRLVTAACVEVYLPGGTQIRLPSGDGQTLAAALEVLARLDAAVSAGEASC